MSILDKLLGSSYQKVIGKLKSKVDRINALESDFQKLTDKELREKTSEFRKKVAEASGDIDRETALLDEITPEVFAVMREAMKRVWIERHFDVQIIGGLVLHQGKIAEMKTGEGKTIVAALPLYLNALTGRGVHLVTVNDYLSKHQGEGMGQVYDFLGLTVGVIQSNQESYKFEKKKDYEHYSQCDGTNLTLCSRKEAYACDVTYGTNNEFGFDYLRDNMAPTLDACVQREQFFAIVDEVDSILIDEARTPLIISAAAEESGSMYAQFAALVPRLSEGEDYTMEEKERSVYLTDEGIKKMERMLGVDNIYDANGTNMVHHLEQALKAHALFKKDRDYVVREGEIIIVDEFTGRLMIGRRYSEGLHQAIEAKEGVDVKRESQTLATVSFQNLFRMYRKLSGMTGTAATEAEEFYKIYTLDVVEIPTNEPVIRKDAQDKIYKTESGKLDAVVRDIKECNEKGQPVLVGTVSVEKNEKISKLLKKAGIKHEILNAKNHEREAKIIVKAGFKGSITVATNMAGRGTDIKLGEGVIEAGGLHVIGTERHEARRIDNQLRGRSGRQGDPGSSQFYVSLEDDLMRIFGGEKIKVMMDRLGLPEDQPIENKLITRSIEGAQRKVEGYNFDIRKHLVEYDDVMNKHREVIYRKRRRILELQNDKGDSIKEEILGIIFDETERIINRTIGDKEKAISELKVIFGDIKFDDLSLDNLKQIARDEYEEKEKRYGSEVMRNIERAVYLRTIDSLWVEHLTTMDELREGIGLRGYGQRDPLVEYKSEAYRLFEGLIGAIESSVARVIYRVEVQVQPTAPIVRKPLEYQAPNPDTIGDIKKDEPMLEEEIKDEKIESRNEKIEMRNEKVENKMDPQTSSLNTQTSQLGGVTTTIRGPKERSVHERMMESGGKQHTIRTTAKVGRNEPCPCGSGKKYKKCCGR